MRDSDHPKYTARGFVVCGKIPIRKDSPAEGVRTLYNMMKGSSAEKLIFIPGQRVPEALSESERNDSRINYFVVYEKRPVREPIVS